jgi:hypothetical protein
MAFQKSGNQAEYERFRISMNDWLNKFEMRTWEMPNEKDVMERITLKLLQREMNALAGE